MHKTSFDFKFSHQGKTIPGTCSVYHLEGQKDMPYKYPIYRIAINSHKINPDVFLFYEINDPGKRFFYYPFTEKKEAVGKSIHQAMEKWENN